jgi:signal peptidase II
MFRNIIGVLLLLSAFLIDRVTKGYILERISDVFVFLGGFVKIHYVENTGVAFGMFKGFNNFFILFNSVLLIFLFYLRRRLNKLSQVIAIHLIIGGAMGNIFDRIKYGYVIDFIEVKYFPWVFNAGDFFITLGAIILFLSHFEEGR